MQNMYVWVCECNIGHRRFICIQLCVLLLPPSSSALCEITVQSLDLFFIHCFLMLPCTFAAVLVWQWYHCFFSMCIQAGYKFLANPAWHSYHFLPNSIQLFCMAQPKYIFFILRRHLLIELCSLSVVLCCSVCVIVRTRPHYSSWHGVTIVCCHCASLIFTSFTLNIKIYKQYSDCKQDLVKTPFNDVLFSV